MSLFGPPDVRKMEQKGDVGGLIKAVRFGAEARGSEQAQAREIRKAAADTLGKIGDPKAVEALVTALTDEASAVRQAAIGALGSIRDRRAVDPLLSPLADGEPVLRRIAADSLGRIGDLRAAVPLAARLRDNDSTVRRAAAAALQTLGWTPSDNAEAAAFFAARGEWDKCSSVGAEAVATILLWAEDPRAERAERREALDSLQNVVDPSALGCLSAALRSPDWQVRYGAAEALGKIGDPLAVAPLCDTMEDPERMVGIAVTEALGKIGDPRGTEMLLGRLKEHADPFVRADIAQVLGTLAKPWAVDPLRAALTDPDDHVRMAVADALGRIGDRRALPELALALSDGHRQIQTQVAKALSSLGWDPESDELGAVYWIALGEPDKCAAIGGVAVDPLLAALDVPGALQVLTDLYRGGMLDETCKAKILATSKSTRQHRDSPYVDHDNCDLPHDDHTTGWIL